MWQRCNALVASVTMDVPGKTISFNSSTKRRKIIANEDIEHYLFNDKEIEDLSNSYIYDSDSEGEFNNTIEESNDDPSELDNNNDDSYNNDNSPNNLDIKFLKWTPGNNFVPNKYDFNDKNSGVSNENINENSKPIDFLCLFINKRMVDKIVLETNKYYELVTKDSEIPLFSKTKRWKETNDKEIYLYISILLLMSHVKKHQISDYWAKDPLLYTEIFHKYMTRDRFYALSKFLHFADNKNPKKDDRIWKIRDIIEIFKENCKENFRPYQKLVIDESLVLFTGRLLFKQYIQTKRHRFGIKLFILCDCKTGIILDLIVYTGTNIDIDTKDQLGVSGAVVKKMLEGYLDLGHKLYTDNWYTSPSLSLFLHNRKTGTCGTVRKNRKGMPKSAEKLKKGDIDNLQSGPLLSIRWEDKREVSLLSTFHTGELINTSKMNHLTNENIKKPDAVVDYNINMRLVDKCDAMIGHVECMRKNKKWYKKLFYHLLDLSIVNSFNLYKEVTKNKITMREFSLECVRSFFTKYGTPICTSPGRNVIHAPDRLAAKDYIYRHYIDKIPITSEKNGKTKGRRCHVCYNSTRKERKRTMVTTWCVECKIPLCFTCFREFHYYLKF